MCVKNIYHNIYSDGRRDITERVDTCRPGHLCGMPLIRESVRTHAYAHRSASRSPMRNMSPSRRTFTYQSETHHLLPPSPVSGHGSSSDREDDRERRQSGRSSTIYVNGERVAESSLRRRDSRRPGRPIIDTMPPPVAPTPPSPLAIPIVRRSSTSPSRGHRSSTAPRPSETRRLRPIIVNGARQSPPSPVFTSDDLAYTYTPRHTRDSYLEVPRAHRGATHRPSLDIEETETPAEREERRRQRRARALKKELAHAEAELRDAYAASPPPSPYSSSYGSLGSSTTSSAQWTTLPTLGNVTPSPAVNEVKKHLRFTSDTDSDAAARAAQNDKIRRRPKLNRAPTGSNAAMQAEVKGILKNPVNPNLVAPKLARTHGLEDLYESVRGLGIEDSRRNRDEREYQDRLRRRFSGPPRPL